MAERSGVFLLQGTDSLVPMEPAQFATENDFQLLLARFPELLVGDQVDPQNPRRWILVGREQPVSTGENGASLWSIDHVFLDQDGIPTLVEIKRQSNTEIRRQVVGQMLDYAANFATFWSVEALHAGSRKNVPRVKSPRRGRSDQAIGSFRIIRRILATGENESPGEKIRLLFIADLIPLELRRIVEFLNEQMDTVEVLAIELRQFASKERRTLVPTVYGQTQEASNRQSAPGHGGIGRPYSRNSSTQSDPRN